MSKKYQPSLKLSGLEMISGAEFSEDKKQRYSLWRIWDETRPAVMFIGLNPSTANEGTNDPTIRRVIGMAQKWGYGGVYMTNLFTIVSTDPKILMDKNSWGDYIEDRGHLLKVSRKCDKIVCAWGNFKEAEGRGSEIRREFPNAYCLVKNKNGSPKHPLYVKSDIEPVKYF